MSFNSVLEMAQDAQLVARIAACATVEGITNPMGWAKSKAWTIASRPGWAEAWDAGLELVEEAAQDFQRENKSKDPRERRNPRSPNVRRQIEIGAREDVITDEMIIEAVRWVQLPDEDGRSPG